MGPFFSATLEWSSPWENPESETECCPCASEVGRCSPARGRPGWPSTLTLVLLGGGERKEGHSTDWRGGRRGTCLGEPGTRVSAQFPSKIKVAAEGPPHLRQSGTHVPTSDTGGRTSAATLVLQGAGAGERPGARGAPSLGETGARVPCLTPHLDALSTRPSSYSLLRNSATERDGDARFSRGGGPEVWEDCPGDSQSPPLPTTWRTPSE